MRNETVLVTGATGKTGRRIVQRLAGSGHVIRAGSRVATPAFDWNDQQTWPSALQDVTAAYLCYYPDIAAPGAARTIESFVTFAVRTGVRRLVLLSGRGEPEAQRCEEVVRGCGVEWTLLRASWFAQNFSENFLLDPILAGEVALPVGHVGEPFVDADDIAEVAVKALTEGAHDGELYELTGPRLWTFAQAVAEIARVTGRDIRFTQVSIDDYAAALRDAQLPSDVADLVVYLFSQVLDGRNASLADGVPRALGRPPRDFAAYAQAVTATGIWKARGR